MVSLVGKKALITGSTSGIGLGLAQAMAQAGAHVMLNGFGDSQGPLQSIRSLGVEAYFHPADMTKVDEIESMMNAAQEQMGGVDILINNAGIQHVAAVEEFPPERWDAILAINLSSAFHTTRLALPYMRQRNWGRIINLASVHGLVASIHKSAYVASKHGLVGLTKVTALETATTGITCNAICPGWVLTPMVQQQIDTKALEMGISSERALESMLSQKEPSLQCTTPQELGELALFLCSDAARNTRGVAWNMDGGWIAQ